ncbi:MAG: hypothetical protein ACK4TF_04880 [Thermodesulfovibrionales bacterium]
MKPQMLGLPVRKSKDITAILKKDPITNLVRKEFPSAFLVGGYIRDLLLGKSSNDRDYVVTGKPDYEKIKKISKSLGGSFFTLKNLARFVLKDQEIDITFTDETIERDLCKRDFTINSIAWSPQDQIIDLHGGLRDIKRRVIRIISSDNIRSDPLRILRAYRLAAENRCSIDPLTRRVLSGLRVLLKTSAKERVTSELIKLLNLEQPDRHLKVAIDDKILQVILDIKEADIINNFKKFKKLSVFYKKNKAYMPEITFSQRINELGFLRLVCLSYKKKKWLIKLSKKNERLLEAFHKVLSVWRPEFFQDKKKLFEVFYDIKDFPEGLGFLLSNRRLLKEAKRFKETLKNPLITGLDIVKGSDIKSRHIGILLKKLLALQFSGKVRTKEDALREIHKLKGALK